MLKTLQRNTFGLIVTFVLLVYLVAGCADSSTGPESTSTPLIIPSADADSTDGELLPDFAVAAATAALPGGTIIAATRDEEDGEVVYEVLMETAEGPFEVDIALDGTVLEIDVAADDEREIAPSELPQAVLDAVEATVPGGRITKAVRESVRGEVVFDVEVDVRGKKFDLEIDPDGNVLEVDEAN